MELTSTQCESAAALIPVLLLAFTIQRNRAGDRHLPGIAKVVNGVAVLALVLAWGFAFLGIDGGLGVERGNLVWLCSLFGLIVLASSLIGDYVFPGSAQRDDHDDHR